MNRKSYSTRNVELAHLICDAAVSWLADIESRDLSNDLVVETSRDKAQGAVAEICALEPCEGIGEIDEAAAVGLARPV